MRIIKTKGGARRQDLEQTKEGLVNSGRAISFYGQFDSLAGGVLTLLVVP